MKSKVHYKFLCGALAYLTIACGTKTEQKHIDQPKTTYVPAARWELDRMRLSTGEVRKALILISDVHAPDDSFFQNYPNILVMKEGYRNARYSVCSIRGEPSVEIGKNREGRLLMLRINVAESVRCLTVSQGNPKSMGQGDFTQLTKNNLEFWFKIVPKKKALFVMFNGLENDD